MLIDHKANSQRNRLCKLLEKYTNKDKDNKRLEVLLQAEVIQRQEVEEEEFQCNKRLVEAGEEEEL